MDFTGLGLAGLGFWLAIAAIVIGYIWSGIQKQRMKHELTLKLLEKGQGVDQELLATLLAADKPGAQQKSLAEKRRDDSGVGGFIFLVAGLILAVIGILGHSELVPSEVPNPTGFPTMVFENMGPSWLLVGLGAFAFAFGNWIFYSAQKEYLREKAEEKSSGK